MDNKINWKTIKWFEQCEFSDPDYHGSGKFMNPVIVYKMNQLREKSGYAIVTHYLIGGCVDVKGVHGHSELSYHRKENGGAVDFHFADPKTFKPVQIDPRIQYSWVEKAGFNGVGIYYIWKWNNKNLVAGFHVDDRPIYKFQKWTCRQKGVYNYFL